MYDRRANGTARCTAASDRLNPDDWAWPSMCCASHCSSANDWDLGHDSCTPASCPPDKRTPECGLPGSITLRHVQIRQPTSIPYCVHCERDIHGAARLVLTGRSIHENSNVRAFDLTCSRPTVRMRRRRRTCCERSETNTPGRGHRLGNSQGRVRRHRQLRQQPYELKNSFLPCAGRCKSC
jgi:hypothetical protein